MKLQSENVNDYLKEDKYIDFSNEDIRNITDKLTRDAFFEENIVEKCFKFVRDKISHSGDIDSLRVTSTASEVLREQEGICYAKSNLLAAMLRYKNIPTGLCYQRLTLEDTPESGYCIHALNAVYLDKYNKWIRIDARGNKDGVDAQFIPPKEKLAFEVRSEYDEVDYDVIYHSPRKETIEALENACDRKELYELLPKKL